MTQTEGADTRTGTVRGPAVLNRVPEVTVFFWMIKILCTTVGETFADYLSETLGLGLDATSLIVSAALVVVLVVQFRRRRYVPGVYWLAVVLISVVGTLLSDELADDIGVPLETTTVVFAVLLAVTFGTWYAAERTLSMHTIVTRRREAFYWLTVLFTFALGTSAGDLLDERLGLGSWPTAGLVAVLIALIWAAHRGLGLNAVGAFWAAYVLTRPLGASIGDGMAQPHDDGGLGLGATGTSLIFLAVILALVVLLTVTRVDRTEERRPDPAEEERAARRRH